MVIDETVRLNHRSQSRIKEIVWSQQNESQFSLIWFLSNGENLSQTQLLFSLKSVSTKVSTFNEPHTHSSVLELRKNQFLKKINVLKTFLEIETTHYLEGLDLKLNNETYAKVPNL